MKVAFDMSSKPVNWALIKVSEVSGLEVTEPEEADLVIANKPERLLHHLKNGKRVAQAMMPGESAAAGLASAPQYADRFTVIGGSDNPLDSLDRLVQHILQKKGVFDESSV